MASALRHSEQGRQLDQEAGISTAEAAVAYPMLGHSRRLGRARVMTIRVVLAGTGC